MGSHTLVRRRARGAVAVGARRRARGAVAVGARLHHGPDLSAISVTAVRANQLPRLVSRADAVPSTSLSASMPSRPRSVTVRPEIGLSRALADYAAHAPLTVLSKQLQVRKYSATNAMLNTKTSSSHQDITLERTVYPQIGGRAKPLGICASQ